MSEGEVWGAVAQAIAEVGGKAADINMARKQASTQYERQKEFAQSGIQWRVRDAEAAGLHPLYAIGANVPTYTPSQPVNFGISEMASRMGQNLSRAARAGELDADRKRVMEMQLAVAASDIRLKDAQADAAYAQAARAAQETALMPGGPSAVDPRYVHGAGDSPQVVVQPSQVVASDPRRPDTERGIGTGLKAWRVGDGVIYLPSANSLAEALEPLSESSTLMALVVGYNIERNPNFLRDYRYLIPGLRKFGVKPAPRGHPVESLGNPRWRSDNPDLSIPQGVP